MKIAKDSTSTVTEINDRVTIASSNTQNMRRSKRLQASTPNKLGLFEVVAYTHFPAEIPVEIVSEEVLQNSERTHSADQHNETGK